MKLIHLSDLHLGKRVYGFSMLEDQEFILKQILSLIQEEAADGVMIAGDIYDRTVPPAEAVQLFDRFLTRTAELGVPVFAVSGNHDSPERIAFGAELMSGRHVYFSPVFDGTVRSVRMEDAYGEVRIHLLPFLKPAMVRHGLKLREEKEEEGRRIDPEQIATYQDALEAAVRCIAPDPAVRNVLIAHQFVAGASRCESEELQVGGVDQISAAVFDDFDYVALGHLHSPQHVGRETVRYCGTPLKYSFSELGQEKSVTVVELGKKGAVTIRKLPLRPLRDMRKIRGSYLEVTARSFYQDTPLEDYIQMILTDEEEVPGGLQKLRLIYPNIMHLEYDNRRTREHRTITAANCQEQKTEMELFAEFYELQNNQPMSETQRAFAAKLIEESRG